MRGSRTCPVCRTRKICNCTRKK
ncbi:putative leucine-rich repeat extensin-like protein 7 [Iris pallida]|uniref:Leucine-rich repeat extensin-like protein 7 n=1 Tax=Iris pallida TaxID=29817 RepID=A0AAX6G3A8_IRIPA|nr:putative leucine-rich repeat extensin-like protein 7 [Iris pallida]